MFLLSAILGVALAIRALAWSQAEMMMNDGPHYLWQAQALFQGDWQGALGHHYAPGFAGATALVMNLVADPLNAAIAVSMAAGLLLVVAAWGIARTGLPHTPNAAPAAALVAALNVRTVAYTSDVQSDGLFAAFFLCAAWALLAAAQREQRGQRATTQALAGGLVMGLAYLVRLEALFLLLPLAMWCLAGLVHQAPGFRRRAALTSMAAAASLLAVAPYVIGLHQATGRWGLSNKPSAHQAGLVSDLSSGPDHVTSPLSWPRVSQRMDTPAAATAPDDSGSSTEPAAQKAQEQPDRGGFLLFDSSPGFLSLAKSAVAPSPFDWGAAINHSLNQFVRALRLEYLLFIVPGLMALGRRRPGLCALLCLTIVAWLAVTTMQLRLSGFLSTRHMMIPLTLLLPVAGAGLVSLWNKNRFWRVLVVLALLEPVEVAARDYHGNHVPRLAALAWIQEHSEPQQLFATHRQRDGYYAQRVPLIVELPVKTANMAANCRVYDVPWMAFDLDKLNALQPEWLEQGLIQEELRFGVGDETVVVFAPAFDGPR
ncbi:MAG: 4-amino-4-deoxy-L-arabinose transferase-like glycosyltransferase [Pseudohongiellaceae bacterium]|jgi:4-amino-4-deoxy-L-arabinose transferase-like glycosyltransferase